MRFRNGAWLWYDGVTPACMKRVTEFGVDGDALDLACVDRAGADHADRFEGVVLAMRITSPMPDCLRVQIRHYHPAEIGATKFDLDYSLAAPNVRIEEQPEHLIFTSGKLSLRIGKNAPWDMQFLDGDSLVTGGGNESLSYMTTRDHGAFISQRFSIGVGECIYGLGERFGPMVKNGQHVEIWNEDAGTVSDQAYKNIPFYLSSRGYGLFVNSPGKVDFEICTERVNQVQISEPGESLDYYIFYGPDPKEVLDKYTRLAGRPAVPPGVVVRALAQHILHHEIRREDGDGIRRWNDRARHSAEGLSLRLLLDEGAPLVRFRMGSQRLPRSARHAPAPEGKGTESLSLDQSLHLHALQAVRGRAQPGILFEARDGAVYQADQWQPGMAYVDFTNPTAVIWFKSKLSRLLEMGVDCFKTDFGERIPG